MNVVVQRVNKASVSVNEEIVGKIDKGLCVLVGFTENDTIEDINYIVRKIINLRIFDDENGVMNKSVLDIDGKILSISQFTLYADTKKGNRPSYVKVLGGTEACKLYNQFNELLKENVEVETGVFGADMQVEIHNNGPVAIIIDSKEK